MKIAIVGRGLIGSAAARHLAESGMDVTLIGPPEGETPGSHWDEGRITRRSSPSVFWSEVASRSIARYSDIEARSGIDIFTQSGSLMAAPIGSDYIADLQATREAQGFAAVELSAGQLARRFPFLTFPENTAGLFEEDTGHISPRRLVAAQTKLAEAAGARLIPAPLTAFEEKGQGITLRYEGGEITADQALIAAGGMTEALLPCVLGLKVFARTVTLLEISPAEAARLAAMPTIILRLPAEEGPYILPPIQYPDGKLYLKAGGDPQNRILADEAEIRRWFATEGDAAVAAHLADQLHSLIPGLAIRARHSAACMTTFSETGRPVIKRLSPSLCVATAGCGAGAKCSDELGRLAACLLQGAPDTLLPLE